MEYPTPEQVMLGFFLQIGSLRKHIGKENLFVMAQDLMVQLQKYGYEVRLLHGCSDAEEQATPSPLGEAA